MDNKGLSKVDLYLAYLAGEVDSYPDNPYTRIEIYLYALCKSGMGGGITPEEKEEIVNEAVEKVKEYYTANPMPAVVSKKE